jgi:hypothetical protein
MPLPLSALEKRAVKAGVKASKKRHHLITEEELLSLRVQVMPVLPRILLMLTGGSLLVAAYLAWPSGSDAIRVLETIFGVLTLFFGVFGIRRTLSTLLDTAVSNIDL